MVERTEIINRLIANLELLRENDPEGWPETLAKLAGTTAQMDVWTLDLLCDAITQVNAEAHLLAKERRAQRDAKHQN